MNDTLRGKAALVTGGTRGIGAAIVRELAACGADVAFSYLSSSEKAHALVQELEGKGVRAAAFQADQADPAQVERLVRQTFERSGRFDILINSAGVSAGAPVDKVNGAAEALDRMYSINYTAVVTAIRAASMVMNDGRRIVTPGSVLGARANFPGLADYSATKPAVVGFSKGAARDLASRNITVKVLQSVSVVTDMNPGSGDSADAQKSMIALRRFAQPEEIAAGVFFLSSPAASYVTGSVLSVDGGFGA